MRQQLPWKKLFSVKYLSIIILLLCFGLSLNAQIRSTYYIEITSPKEGTGFRKGDPLTIKWKCSKYKKSDKFGIQLVPAGGGRATTLKSNLNCGQGSLKTRIPLNISSGKYFIKVTGKYQWNSTKITIAEQSGFIWTGIKLTSPRKGAAYKWGQKIRISWTTGNLEKKDRLSITMKRTKGYPTHTFHSSYPHWKNSLNTSIPYKISVGDYDLKIKVKGKGVESKVRIQIRASSSGPGFKTFNPSVSTKRRRWSRDVGGTELSPYGSAYPWPIPPSGQMLVGWDRFYKTKGVRGWKKYYRAYSYRGLIKINNISAIKNKNIKKATLKMKLLKCDETKYGSSRNYSAAHKLNVLNAPWSGWSTSLTRYRELPHLSARNGYLSVDITHIVRDWASGKKPNYGIILIPEHESISKQNHFKKTIYGNVTIKVEY